MRESSRTAELSSAGVSIWLDDLSRERITSGDLQQLMATRNVVGITTNPTIFAAAILSGDAYASRLRELAESGVSARDAVLDLTTHDVAQACDVLAPVHAATAALDGWVSIEVSPVVAHDADATIEEAERLLRQVDRPNAYIKIPATQAGVSAIREATSRGISVNVTLIFSLTRYREVVDAYLDGLEAAKRAGIELSSIHSVASFFVSRVDVEVDRRLDTLGTPQARQLRGRVAISNARLAYDEFTRAFGTGRGAALVAEGAHPQRPLWASTGVKDPTLPDTRYVVELVARDVVNTMPEKTLAAVADHAELRGDTISSEIAASHQVLDALAALGISYDDVTDTLEREGIEKFTASWDELLHAVTDALDAR